MATRVFQLGIIRHSRERGEPRTTIPAEIWDEQLRLGHKFKNALASLEIDHERRQEELWLSYPSVQGPAAALDAAEGQLEELLKQARRERSADRSTAARPDTAAEIKTARAAAKAARAAKKQAVADVRHTLAKRQLEKLKADLRNAIDELRQEYAAAGLYWATYNAVLDHHKVRIQMLARARREGRPARLHFSRYRGEGSVAVQLQRTHGDKCRCRKCATWHLDGWLVARTGEGLLVLQTPPRPRRQPKPKAVDVAGACEVVTAAEDLRIGQVRLEETDNPRLWRIVPGGDAPLRETWAAARAGSSTAGLLVARVAGGHDEPVDDTEARAIIAADAGVPADAIELVPTDADDEQCAILAPRVRDGVRDPELGPPPKDPPRTAALLADAAANPWRNVLQVRPWMPPAEFEALPLHKRREIAYGEVVWSVGQGRTVTLPVRVDRMLPEDAEICEAELTIRRTAGHWTADLNLTIQVPDPEPVQGRPAVALHTGWRKRPDDSARVAVWSATKPLTVAGNVADLVVAHDGGRWGEVILPARWIDDAGRPAAVRSKRDVAFERVRARFADWLDANPHAHHERLTPGWVRLWRSPNRLAHLAIRWREVRPAGADEIWELVEAWRVQDKHLWESESHDRKQQTARRDDAYRRVAAWLAGQAGMLIVDDTDLRAIRQRAEPDDTDPTVPGVVADRARARAALVSPGRLRLFSTQTAERDGVAVVKVSGKGATVTHRDPACGHRNKADARFAAAAVVLCLGCGGTYDQDCNASDTYIDRATGRTP